MKISVKCGAESHRVSNAPPGARPSGPSASAIRGTVVDAFTGPALTAASEEKIRQALADPPDGTALKVWRTPMFSVRRVEQR